MYPEPPWICTARSAIRPTASLAKYLATDGASRCRCRVVAGRGVEHQRAGRHVLGLRVGQHGLYQLVVGDRVPPWAFPGVGDGLVECTLRGTDARAAMISRPCARLTHRRGVAGRLGSADQGVGGHAHGVEVDLRGPGALLAHLGVLRADGEAGRAGGHEEHRDAGAILVGGTVRANTTNRSAKGAFVM